MQQHARIFFHAAVLCAITGFGLSAFPCAAGFLRCLRACLPADAGARARREPSAAFFAERALLLEDVHRLLVRLTRVNHNWHVQLVRQADLAAKPVALILRIRVIIVKIQPDLADRLHLRLPGQAADLFVNLLCHRLRIVWMHTDRRVAPRQQGCVRDCPL